MKVVKANPKNQKHISMYAAFCKQNGIHITLSEEESMYQKRHYFFLEKENQIIENCQVEVIEDLKQAVLAITKTPHKKGNHLFKLIQETLAYLFAREPELDIFLQVENQEIVPRLEALGYDILSLGTDDTGQYIYSILKDTVEEE